ncbi:MAG: TetR family transcriptional regulator [Pelomonas sp.]|nr:TetR family transcriptional regulator [Roseateles sp.]
MAQKHVRVPGPDAGLPADPAVVRRRPRQARARLSAEALQQAFVRVLLERGYAKTTIREVAAVAGVGVGTFYEYFGNMRSLAAKCISEAVRGAERAGRAAAAPLAGQPRARIAAALADALVAAICADARAWAALFLLERQISTPAAYRDHYEAWVRMWGELLAGAADPPPPGAARMAHAISYGWISQSLMTAADPAALDVATLREELLRALRAYLAAADAA